MSSSSSLSCQFYCNTFALVVGFSVVSVSLPLLSPFLCSCCIVPTFSCHHCFLSTVIVVSSSEFCFHFCGFVLVAMVVDPSDRPLFRLIALSLSLFPFASR
jgi:hypothetical protein